MNRTILSSLLLPLLVVAAPAHAQDDMENNSSYLQQRAASLNDRIDIAVRTRQLSKKRAARLRITVGQVQTLAGNLQTRNGRIDEEDADRMNQQLTDVERALTHQP